MRQGTGIGGAGGSGSGVHVIVTYDVSNIEILNDIYVCDATQDQVDFALTFNYNVGRNELHVYSSGIKCVVGADYIENTSTSIRFVTPRIEGERIVVERFRSVTSP